jgi:hypothetical protein
MEIINHIALVLYFILYRGGLIYMVHNLDRDDQYIARLADFFLEEYGIAANAITPAKRGWYGEIPLAAAFL